MPPNDIRPLAPIVRDRFPATPLTAISFADFTRTRTYSDLVAYFKGWPRHSFMTDDSRAVLYALIRILRPRMVVEIGTLFAGTAQVMARALWENGEGMLHTTDPFGTERCPAIIGTWPRELQVITRFHSLNSMDFFVMADQQKFALDLVLVDGNHDYEFALFDLQMAARLLRPGGVIVMDNAEQTGPFQASRTFLAAHPAWHELGNSISSYDVSNPFDANRASAPGTTFVLLRAPPYLSIGLGPHSWGQLRTERSSVAAFALELPDQITSGTLYYQVIFRAFGDENRAGSEDKSIGSITLDLKKGEGARLEHKLDTVLSSNMRSRHADAAFTFEIDLSWQAHAGCPPLALGTVPKHL